MGSAYFHFTDSDPEGQDRGQGLGERRLLTRDPYKMRPPTLECFESRTPVQTCPTSFSRVLGRLKGLLEREELPEMLVAAVSTSLCDFQGA